MSDLKQEPKKKLPAVLFDLAEVPASTVPFKLAEISAKARDVGTSHVLRGSWHAADGENALILIKFLPGSLTRYQDTDMAILAYGWDGTYGSALTFTMLQRTELEGKRRLLGRSFIPGTATGFDKLRAKNFYFGLVANDRVFRFLKAAPLQVQDDENFKHAVRRVLKHAPEYRDDELFYWELLKTASVWDRALTTEDHLSTSWYSHYSAELRMLFKIAEDSREEFERHRDFFSTLPPYLKESTEAFFDHGLEAAVKAFERHAAGSTMVGQLFNGQEQLCDANLFKTLQYFGAQLFRVCLDSAALTNFGQRLPWIDGWTQKIGFQEINYAGWTEEQVKSYWASIDRDFRIDRPAYLSPEDYPIDPEEESAAFASVKLGCSFEEADALVSALLEEATANRKWVIPPRTKAAIPVGNFNLIEFTEIRDEIYCVLRTDTFKYFQLSFNPSSKRWATHFRHEDEGSTRAREVEAALKMLLAAFVRDFWVVEDRRTVFGRATGGLGRVRIPKREADSDGPVIIYLPRIRYTSEPDLDRCAKGLEIEQRRQHFVQAHLRKTNTASGAQLRLATLYGVSVPSGFTFVRPHERGGAQREVMYRSRSALQLLYSDSVNEENGSHLPSWFEFEKDVRTLLENNGFEIQRVSSPGRADAGVDILAFRKTRKTTQVWAIQCKCYSKKVIGPAYIRELIGSMTQQGHGGIRGMLVTTSTFSSGAVHEAKKANIALIDGAAFVAAKERSVALHLPED